VKERHNVFREPGSSKSCTTTPIAVGLLHDEDDDDYDDGRKASLTNKGRGVDGGKI
jgi:hypothetical protein